MRAPLSLLWTRAGVLVAVSRTTMLAVALERIVEDSPQPTFVSSARRVPARTRAVNREFRTVVRGRLFGIEESLHRAGPRRGKMAANH